MVISSEFTQLLTDARVQIADMHYGNGAKTSCLDLSPKELRACSDVNTTLFIKRLLASNKPDLVVFTGEVSLPGRAGSD